MGGGGKTARSAGPPTEPLRVSNLNDVKTKDQEQYLLLYTCRVLFSLKEIKREEKKKQQMKIHIIRRANSSTLYLQLGVSSAAEGKKKSKKGGKKRKKATTTLTSLLSFSPTSFNETKKESTLD